MDPGTPPWADASPRAGPPAIDARTRVPVAEYIRQGIDLVLDKYRGDLPGQLTLEDVGRGKK